MVQPRNRCSLKRSNFVATQGERMEYSRSYMTDEQRRVAAKRRVRVGRYLWVAPLGADKVIFRQKILVLFSL